MKKVLYFLGILVTLLVLPLTVFAADPTMTPSIPDKAGDFKQEDLGNGTTKKTYTIYMTFENFEANGVTTTQDPIKFSFTFGPAIKSWECKKEASSAFNPIPNTAEKNCTFQTSTNITDGKKVLGLLEVVQDNNFKTEDCWVKYSFDGSSFNVNPPTGASLPYLFIIGGVVVGSVLYFATKKNNKLVRV